VCATGAQLATQALAKASKLPAQYAINTRLFGSPVQQLFRPARTITATIEVLSLKRSLLKEEDGTTVLLAGNKPAMLDAFDGILLMTGTDTEKGRWIKPAPLVTHAALESELSNFCKRARASWFGQFAIREEKHLPEGNGQAGLRSPQVGALYAALAHWKVTEEPGTIVMPTGTGKTETMLTLLGKECFARLLVIVPTNALRDQIAKKFLTFGVLKEFDIMGSGALFPVVGTLRHRPNSIDQTKRFFNACNVVVTTMAVAGGCSDPIQKAMAESCSHLFIDEAHHIAAPTWNAVKKNFLSKPILQFTATPYRRDGQHVDGKLIFSYPLRKAQAEGYFRKVWFRPVEEWDFSVEDQTIASAAIDQLKDDQRNSFDHIVMARVDNIERAEAVHEIYSHLAPEFRPIIVHSKQAIEKRRAAMQMLNDRKTRIVVCVDMLGEGFDLPELKIAALHDVHKSLAVTLQFTGRFTRTKKALGDATVIANIANSEVEDSLRALYAEDSDWNTLLGELSEGATGRYAQRSEFLESFAKAPGEISLQTILPKMSTVVYRTMCSNWQPSKVQKVFEKTIFGKPKISGKFRVLVFVNHLLEPVDWGDVKELENESWDLYMAHWDQDRSLLFINSSNNSGTHESLAKCIAGSDVELIKGEEVFRTFRGLNRLILMNLGLTHSISRRVRFTMYVGADVYPGLSDAQTNDKIKTNLFGYGYEGGARASVGASKKGRIWSHKIANDISEWLNWCAGIGTKLLDPAPIELLRNALIPKQLASRPSLVPLSIEWPEEFYQRNEEGVYVEIQGTRVPFFEANLDLSSESRTEPIKFRVTADTQTAEYEIKFSQTGVEYSPTTGKCAEIISGPGFRKRLLLSDWFKREWPTIHYESGALSTDDQLFERSREVQEPFQLQKIDIWDWTGVNIKHESQKQEKLADSIQYAVIKRLLGLEGDAGYEIIFDDDDGYEAADVVAIKILGRTLKVDLFHCKYSKGTSPGGRVEDLYVVCGQAQRSVHWKGDPSRLCKHLRLREQRRIGKGRNSRFERGDLKSLGKITSKASTLEPDFTIWIVQPGLSKSVVSSEQLRLLASTELYLKETSETPLKVIGSK
jgi:superfamily II DNA or RNA helicase